jgi:phosphoglycerate dehydrogenase-like enzyme
MSGAGPLPLTHLLWEMPNALLTSHTAGFSVEACRHSLFTTVHDTSSTAHGLPPRHPVPELRDRPHPRE